FRSGINNQESEKRVSFPQSFQNIESHLSFPFSTASSQKTSSQKKHKALPYREVFEFFMEEFKTYKPLLASIKNEYDLTIAHLQEKLHSLEAVNAILVTASDQCTRQILALQKQEKIEITNLKKERLYLLEHIDKMKEEKCSLEMQFPASIKRHLLWEFSTFAVLAFTTKVVTCSDLWDLLSYMLQVAKMRKAVAEEYLRYLNECDARKLLLIDLNEIPIGEDKGEDTVKLTLALKMARQDLSKAQVDLNTMRANYGDVVPRREFELQEQKYNDLAVKMEILQKDFNDLQNEYETMLDVHKQVSEERDQFYNDLINVQRASTPRPHWDKCADVIAGGPERWSTLSEGKTSDQLVDILLEDLGTGLLREKETFVGMGKGERVPVFLRCDGLVKNKKMTKKEVVAIVREIWREKNAFDQQKGKQSNLAEFFLNFFQRKYGDVLAFDWTYSIYETIKLYRTNETMTMFHNILMGTVSSLHSHIAFLRHAQDTPQEIGLALKAAFPLKTEEEVQELLEAAGFKPEIDTVTYKHLFVEDEEGKSELLVTKIRNQYVSEKQAYLRELRIELGTLVEVRPDDLRAAFCAIDHSLPEQMLDSYICWAFQLPKEQLDPAITMPIDLLMQRLMGGDIRCQGAISGDAKYLLSALPAEEMEGPTNT
ncbi:hypothetical protein JD844_000281, partial [Phrynosoma platyrhinos]